MELRSKFKMTEKEGEESRQDGVGRDEALKMFQLKLEIQKHLEADIEELYKSNDGDVEALESAHLFSFSILQDHFFFQTKIELEEFEIIMIKYGIK